MTMTETPAGAWDFEDEDPTDQLEPGEPQVLRCAEPGCDFSTLSASGLKRHVTRTHGSSGADSPRRETPDNPQESPETEPAPEIAPRVRAPSSGGLVGRWKERWKRRADATGTTGAGQTKAKPKRVPVRGRVPIVDDVSRSYARLGGRLEFTPYFPTGRLMQAQAPAAGLILDRAIAGTVVDRMVVQPMWRSKERWSEPFYLFGPTVLTFTMQQAVMRQQQAVEEGRMEDARKLQGSISGQAEMLSWMLRDSIIKLAPAMKEARERRAAEDEVIREAFPELPPGSDPVQELISMLFTPPGAPAPGPMPAEEATENE